MWTYETYDDLYHHGIKGQKWGIRRYQNPDGTLTAEGKIRLGRTTRRAAGVAAVVGGTKAYQNKNNNWGRLAEAGYYLGRKIGWKKSAAARAKSKEFYDIGQRMATKFRNDNLKYTYYSSKLGNMVSGQTYSDLYKVYIRRHKYWSFAADSVLNGFSNKFEYIGEISPYLIAGGAALVAGYTGAKLITGKIREKESKLREEEKEKNKE